MDVCERFMDDRSLKAVNSSLLVERPSLAESVKSHLRLNDSPV